jgi:hypothetical protein
MVCWFSGASILAVTTGAYRAVEFIRRNIRLEGVARASVSDSKKVVGICTQYTRRGRRRLRGGAAAPPSAPGRTLIYVVAPGGCTRPGLSGLSGIS